MLIQVVFALRLLHLGLHAGLDLFLDLEDRNLPLHQAIDPLQPVADIGDLQERLFFRQLHAQMPGDRVGQLRRIVDLRDGGYSLLRDVLVQLDVFLELIRDSPRQRVDRRLIGDVFGQNDGVRLEILLAIGKGGDLSPGLALHQHFHCAVGQFQQLQHIGDCADAIDAVRPRFILRRILLRSQKDRFVLFHHRFERQHGFFPAHEKRDDHMRENHDVAERQDRQRRAIVGPVRKGHIHHMSALLLRRTAPPLT